ncbi:MAG TPA: TIGR00730 family Rossman fold protein [Magnetospirillaceae bacterium]|jgi:hypothetical protein
MKSVCVFCGSNPGRDPAYMQSARDMGKLIGQRGMTMLYGGGSLGLMGASADACLDAGGKVIGVIPRSLLQREQGHGRLTEQHVVGTMHERKAMMNKLSDGFIILPGGVGTLEEFFEIWSWANLGIHAKPFGVLEVNGFWAPMFTFLDRMTADGFVRPEYRALVQVKTDPATLLAAMESYTAPANAVWLAEDRI